MCALILDRARAVRRKPRERLSCWCSPELTLNRAREGPGPFSFFAIGRRVPEERKKRYSCYQRLALAGHGVDGWADAINPISN